MLIVFCRWALAAATAEEKREEASELKRTSSAKTMVEVEEVEAREATQEAKRISLETLAAKLCVRLSIVYMCKVKWGRWRWLFGAENNICALPATEPFVFDRTPQMQRMLLLLMLTLLLLLLLKKLLKRGLHQHCLHQQQQQQKQRLSRPQTPSAALVARRLMAAQQI